MLTKVEIDSYYYKIHKYLINLNEEPINTLVDKNLSVVVDGKHRMLAIAKNHMSAKALATFDRFVGIGFKTYDMTDWPNININRSECWKYRLNQTKTEWEINLNIYSIEELHHYILINQKVFYLDKLHQTMEVQRLNENNLNSTQQYIYISKYLECKDILNNNVEVDNLMDYPFTSSYAELMGLSLQQAAKSIKLQHESHSGYFAESEILRLKYKNFLLKETDITKLKNYVDNYIVESERYGDL